MAPDAWHEVRRTARRTLTVIGLVLATALGLLLVYATRRVLVWILVAVFFAVALNPAVDWMQQHVPRCRRWLATLVVFLAVFALLGGLGALFVVPLVHQGARIADELPRFVEQVQSGDGPIGRLSERYHIVEHVRANAEPLREHVAGLGGPTVAVARGAAITAAAIVTIFVLSYLMVLQAPKVTGSLLALLPARRAERARRLGHECARTITGYLTGNLLISVIAGTGTFIALTVLGVPFAPLIALFVGITDLIPLVGATIGAVVAVLAGFTQSMTAGIVLIVFFVVYQQVENHLLQPVIFARTVKLNPLTVLISILIGVELAGIAGALLAIPVAAMIQIVVRDLWGEHRRRAAAAGGGPDRSADDTGPAGTGRDTAPPDEAGAAGPAGAG
ncbi:AI-2E family transporter [Polymorphospora rubra]|uniref:AI-2E family transporter n=1 Tax=Polymorphospora rubra TaxID=338584 RepID=UPI0033C2BC13